jgi:hypothetical protein
MKNVSARSKPDDQPAQHVFHRVLKVTGASGRRALATSGARGNGTKQREARGSLSLMR